MKSVCVFFLFFLTLHMGFALITKIQCSTSDKRTCIKPVCSFVKNNTDVLASYGCRELSKPLYKINVHFQLYAKMYSQYFQVGYFPKFDYCDFIKSYDKKNFFYLGVNLLKDRMADSVHECPYADRQLQISNLTLTKRDFMILLPGKYKVICTFSDDEDNKILKMVTHLTV